MNEQMKEYGESLAKTPEPILLSQCPQVKMDLQGMMRDAKSQGKKVVDLTEEEKHRYI